MIICVTPVRNEAWILDRFLATTSIWADKIVVADQGSTDGSQAIAARYPKVLLVENGSSSYDEGARQRLLLEAARSFEGRRFIMALDADEMLSADVEQNQDWAAVAQEKPGTVVCLPWVNLTHGFRRCWYVSRSRPFGFVDDGATHSGAKMHSLRIPVPEAARRLEIRRPVVLHYQYVDWPRMLSKHRWYQCWEAVAFPERSAIEIFRRYSDFLLPRTQSGETDLKEEWLKGYQDAGIDMTSVPAQMTFWWDEEVLQWLQQHQAGAFCKLPIWDHDWLSLAKERGIPDRENGSYADPRSWLHRLMHTYLRRTQAARHSRLVKTLDRWFVKAGW